MRSVLKERDKVPEIDFGYIKLTLKEFLDSHDYTRHQLSKNANIDYQTVDRYYKATDIDRVDVTLLAKICYSLNCDITDIIKYIPPEKQSS